MKSESYGVHGRISTSPEKQLLLREAQQLLSEHGDKADLVAARLADDCFAAGDDAAAIRWTVVFRFLAESHLRQMRKRLRSTAAAAQAG